ncbi:hypothetical protein ACT3TI_02615 [Psychrobacter sp. AOP22-C1-22]|uniref:hypothetical protein n=1 Tax=unclassified Psychrobacter TaxID=196806 RepID=UPI0017881305|nr:hypothetical protein [Psychrobacter sp. FME6]MBE0406552.1 hypothetical protein [Psychrobacter sp. FME6]
MPLSKYNVGDLMVEPSNLKVLMVLESPHINEYIHGHPAAGESALELTQLLKSQGYVHDFDTQLPVGCNIKALHYQPLGILNCSHLPMNPAFYPCDLDDEAQAQVNNIVGIKQHLAQDIKNAEQYAPTLLAQTDIFKDFARRLTLVLKKSPDIIIVPCGYTAKGFVDTFTTTYPKPLNILYGLPHPTEPEWDEKIATIDLTDYITPEILP